MIIRATLKGIQPEIAIICPVIDAIFTSHGHVCVMTSAVRDKGPKSLHPMGFAIDFDSTRTVDPVMWKRIEKEAREALGNEYDVLAHDAGSGMHLHVEYDPR